MKPDLIMDPEMETLRRIGDDEPYWEISGPRKYLNIPTVVPDKWRAALTFGSFPHFETVIGWGPTEKAAKDEAVRKSTGR